MTPYFRTDIDLSSFYNELMQVLNNTLSYKTQNVTQAASQAISYWQFVWMSELNSLP